ncbi:Quinol monooxygenase YgiN [Novosphingobium lubricantis]|jgi:quinol monooxygenase YgiN
MGYVRYYAMTAREGEGAALRGAIEQLAAKVAPLAGCEGTELFEDAAQAGRFVFLERWTSAEAHQEGGKLLGKEAFAPLKAVLAAPPEAAALIPVG